MKYFFAASFVLFLCLGIVATVIDIFYIYGVLTK